MFIFFSFTSFNVLVSSFEMLYTLFKINFQLSCQIGPYYLNLSDNCKLVIHFTVILTNWCCDVCFSMSCTLIDIFTSFPVQERLDTQSDRVEATNREPTSLENTDASDASFKPKRCKYFYLVILVFSCKYMFFCM